jgi:hypothetical protein
MKIRIQLIIDNDERTRRDIARWERTSFASETLGLQLDEAKALLQTSQQVMVSAQVESYLAKQVACPHCGSRHRLKGRHEIVVRSLFGTVHLGSPRFRRCSCQGLSSPGAGKSTSPLAAALPDRTLPERLYLESKWASLVSYGVTAQLLEDVLPLDGQVNANGIRRHIHQVARRCERDLQAEQDTEPRAEEWPTDNIPPPKPAITVGLDGGYIRSRDAPNRNEGWFEVIAGKSTVQQGGSSCFAFVHRLDRHARARIGSVLKSQGLVYHQPVTFVTDGGDTVRSWPKRLHPRAEHVIDWFHIAMRFTVLKQMTKGISIADANPEDPDDHPERLLDSAKWYLWHGNVHHSLERIDTLIELIEHDERVAEGPERRKLARTLNELYDYLESNRDLIPDYGDRRRHGEAISSSIAESTVNQVISRRFVKKQQMRWQPETAHLLLQVRTQTLNGTLRETFQRWWPAMTPISAPLCRSLSQQPGVGRAGLA